MIMNNILKENNLKLKNSKLCMLYFELDSCKIYPEFSEKKVENTKIDKKTIYELVNSLKSLLSIYRSSFIISINEFCVNPLIEEFLKIKKVFKNIKVLLEKFKDDEKLITHYKVLVNILDINKFFLDDLTYLSSKNNFEYDKEKVNSAINK